MSNEFIKKPGCSGKKKKKIMKEFRIDEISAVDYGAQEPAVAVLMKRCEESPENFEKLMTMTSVEDGHVHAVYIHGYHFEEGGGMTEEAGGEENEHSHPFIIGLDGTITIGENMGHTHELDSMLMQRLAMQNSVQKREHVIKDNLQTLTKSVEGKKFTANDFAFIGDVNNVETWKHRLVRSPGGNPDRRLVGNAVTALKRGQIPDCEKMSVIRRVRAAWLKCNSRSTSMPSVLKRVSI